MTRGRVYRETVTARTLHRTMTFHAVSERPRMLSRQPHAQARLSRPPPSAFPRFTLTVLVIGFISALSQMLALAQAQTPIVIAGNDSISVAILITGQCVIFLTTIVGLIASWFRETRNRKWDLEDRQVLAAKVQTQVDLTRDALHDKTEEVRVQHAKATEALGRKIDENTEISRSAFHEANDVNTKLLDVRTEIARLTAMFLSDTRQREEFFRLATERKPHDQT